MGQASLTANFHQEGIIMSASQREMSHSESDILAMLQFSIEEVESLVDGVEATKITGLISKLQSFFNYAARGYYIDKRDIGEVAINNDRDAVGMVQLFARSLKNTQLFQFENINIESLMNINIWRKTVEFFARLAGKVCMNWDDEDVKSIFFEIERSVENMSRFSSLLQSKLGEELYGSCKEDYFADTHKFLVSLATSKNVGISEFKNNNLGVKALRFDNISRCFKLLSVSDTWEESSQSTKLMRKPANPLGREMHGCLAYLKNQLALKREHNQLQLTRIEKLMNRVAIIDEDYQLASTSESEGLKNHSLFSTYNQELHQKPAREGQASSRWLIG